LDAPATEEAGVQLSKPMASSPSPVRLTWPARRFAGTDGEARLGDRNDSTRPTPDRTLRADGEANAASGVSRAPLRADACGLPTGGSSYTRMLIWMGEPLVRSK